jgi:multidrug efflux system outer membrane protein
LKWFELFKDEELQKLISEALESNYDLRDAVARVDVARGNLGITRADQFPAIGASTNVTTLRNSVDGSFPLPPGFDQRRTFGGLALNLLSFEADIWGRLRSATQAAQADLLATEENRKAVTMTLVGDVAGAYFNLLESDMELTIAERTLNTREESLKIIKSRERNGLATTLEVRQGEQLVQAAQLVIPSIEQRIDLTETRSVCYSVEHLAPYDAGVC